MQAGLRLCCSQTTEDRFSRGEAQIISKSVFLPSPVSRRVVVSHKQKYVHKVKVNRLVKFAQEKSVVKKTDRPNMTIAVDWDVKHQTKNNSYPLSW